MQYFFKITIFNNRNKFFGGQVMGLKFDGRYLKDGGKTLANVYRDALKEGSSSGGKTLGNLYRDIVKEGSSSGGKSLCNISRGDIKEGSSSGGRKLISLKDAAKKIGSSGQGPTVALVWWFFGK